MPRDVWLVWVQVGEHAGAEAFVLMGLYESEALAREVAARGSEHPGVGLRVAERRQVRGEASEPGGGALGGEVH